MVGHADACGQDGVKMRWINLANRHGLGGDGPACGQKGNHIWHKTSMAGDTPAQAQYQDAASIRSFCKTCKAEAKKNGAESSPVFVFAVFSLV